MSAAALTAPAKIAGVRRGGAGDGRVAGAHPAAACVADGAADGGGAGADRGGNDAADGGGAVGAGDRGAGAGGELGDADRGWADADLQPALGGDRAGGGKLQIPSATGDGKTFYDNVKLDLPLYPPGLGGKLVVDGRDSPPMERCPRHFAQVEERQFELPDVQESASGVETRASAGSKCRSRGPHWISRAVRSTIRNSDL